MTLTPSKFFYRAVPILLGLLLLARLIGMAAAPLLDTTEARYGEISRKMAELNDWITPWFDHGVPYWGKPPLAFWVTAISFNHGCVCRRHHVDAATAPGILGGLRRLRRERGNEKKHDQQADKHDIFLTPRLI